MPPDDPAPLTPTRLVDSTGGSVPVPDPTTLTATAVSQAKEDLRRDIAALRETIETRLDGMGQDRSRLWARLGELPGQIELATNHFREEMDRRDTHVRELVEQRLADLDKAIRLAADELAKVPARTEDERIKIDVETARRMSAEREYIMGQIANSLAETRRVEAVAIEKFQAIDALFGSNALALTAALAAQEKAAAEQNRSNTLAIDKSATATSETIRANAAQTMAGIQALSDTFSDIKDRVVRLESVGVGIRQQATEQRLSQGAIVSLIVGVIVGLGLIVSTIALVVHK